MDKYKIIASLTYGKKISLGVLVLIYIGLLLSVAIVPFAIFCAIIYTEYEALVCLFLPLIGIPGLSYIIIVVSRENRNIKRWKRDSVLLSAHISEVDRIENVFTNIVILKISVKFIYNGTKMTQESGEKNNKKGNIFYSHPGYDAIFLKCIGHGIRILYSPAYDQVLLIKNCNKICVSN